MQKKIRIFVVMLVIILPSWVLAQAPAEETVTTVIDNPVPDRDPVDLAIRFQDLDPATLDIQERPDYQLGASESFFVGGITASDGREVLFDLAAVNSAIYLWVERGMDYDPAQAQFIAERFEADVAPRIRTLFGPERDVDGDPRVHVLSVMGLPGLAGVYIDTDSYPDEVFPTSNEINSLVMAIPINGAQQYLSVLAHEFQHMVQANQDDSEESWIVEGIAELGSFLAVPEFFSGTFHALYLNGGTINQLNFWPALQSTAPYYGGASLFLTYLTQRYGEEWITVMAQEPSNGILGLEKALAVIGATDPLTGEDITFNDAFADFVIANFVNDPTLSDGRYSHQLVNIAETAPITFSLQNFPVNFPGQFVNQYGTQYIEIVSATDQSLLIDFIGRETNRVLPTQPYEGDYFYWSQRENQANAKLTGRFDLSSVSAATLNFWTWYDIENLWDYGYISVSADEGASWDTIVLPRMTDENPFDRAFAAGYTGRSLSEEARPAPYIGVNFNASLIVTAVLPNTPAVRAGLQVGDRLLSVDSAFLTADNFNNILDQYAVGDVVNILISRDQREIETMLELGTHPTRMTNASTSWIQQTVDLTPYAGQEILVRFDFVTDQATVLPGWLLDQVEIPEIGFVDGFETPNPVWEAEGWVRINNRVPQDYLVQMIELGNPTSVRRLMEPGDGQRGTWRINMRAGQRFVLAVSGIASITNEPAPYDLSITPEG